MQPMERAERIFESWERDLWQKVYDLSFCHALDEGKEPYQAAEEADWEVLTVASRLAGAD